ncbi:MAG: hypothetical protein JWP64_2253 [Pseudonocardia sp.]|jgi:hypothetical protein|uniref:hypothetical protein n=1 Tax=Pseudonocardia sp. TaxID=60912 RepID=UPI0026269AD3|nr:hypothetical protein [Pseudonocardia sp.]MCU1627304.1 hypothetical protein [Pseudonocardia sp.]MDT7699937.1 hypothetical protein [Pseudonocardiales bacterium]HEV7468577.1 hypothetical protein [Pseudonocardia sp.]
MADDPTEPEPASPLHEDHVDDLAVADDEGDGGETEESEQERRPKEGGPDSGVSGEWRGDAGPDLPT